MLAEKNVLVITFESCVAIIRIEDRKEDMEASTYVTSISIVKPSDDKMGEIADNSEGVKP